MILHLVKAKWWSYEVGWIMALRSDIFSNVQMMRPVPIVASAYLSKLRNAFVRRQLASIITTCS